MQLAEQEASLGNLGAAVGRLKILGRDMNVELQSQNAMLSDLEAGLDESASGIEGLKSKMKALLPKKEPREKVAILVLSVLLAVLLFLVMST